LRVRRDKESSRGALSVWLCLALALLVLAAGAARADAAPVPLIVDTDMFSDADDVGALATAYGLQIRREAEVIAVAVNAPLDRGAVATSSWRCVAAISAFYGSASVPIGTAMPNNRSSAGDAGFATPCASSAPASTPAPVDAVTLYRRALAAQPDGSVVIASVGYLGNLAGLLDSAPDAISTLNGRDLIARKVKTLVVMGGGYPSRNGETNVSGDPPAARNVSDNWPTKIVWSGFEVGAAVHTGRTISSEHPAGSPVRVAYEAFVGPGRSIESFDPSAVYDAVRPGDRAMHEVGPGINAISDTGANSFRAGAGSQFYLALDSATSLEGSIEALLGTLPGDVPPESPAPPPAAPPSPVRAPAAPPPHAPAAVSSVAKHAPAPDDPFVFFRLGALRIKTPASWTRRRGRFAATLASGCKVTVLVRSRRVATRTSAAHQVLVGTSRPGAGPAFGRGHGVDGAWAVGSKPVHLVRGRASIRIAKRRYLQVVADGMLGARCSGADAAPLAKPIRTLVRMAAYVPRQRSGGSASS
jgi:hypothetical protein